MIKSECEKRCFYMSLSLISGHEERKRQSDKKEVPCTTLGCGTNICLVKCFRCICTRHCCCLESFLVFVKLACAIIVSRKTPCEANYMPD